MYPGRELSGGGVVSKMGGNATFRSLEALIMNVRNRNRMLAAIAAAVPIVALTLPAPAQQRVNNGGRAMDANTRVGSDGSNDRNNGLDNRGPSVTGNQIVTGNVTGGREFRGPVGYRDPLEFRGSSASDNSDRLVRGSVGAPTRTDPTVGYGAPTGFYGDRRATPPPPGYRPQGFTGGLYNTGVGQQTVAGRSPYETASSWSAFANNGNLLRPGRVVLDGGVDQNNQPQLLSASPLYGVLPVRDLNAQAGTPGMPGMQADDLRAARNRGTLNPADLERMRQELNDAAQPDDNGGDNNPAQDPNNLAQPLQAQSLNNAVDATAGGNTASAGAAAAASRNQASQDVSRSAHLDNKLQPDRLGADSGTQQGVQSSILIPPSKQSKQYAELDRRFRAQQSAGAVTPEQANMQQRLLQNAQKGGDAGGAAAPGAGKPGADAGAQPREALPVTRQPGGARPQAPKQPQERPKAEQPSAPAPEAATEVPAPQPQAAEHPAPLKIKSLADGVEAKGLRDLLREAEDQMHKGNFRTAIERYSAAEQVAPNNPLIRLGRAQANLGAARYVTAEQNLREAVEADPALLVGQYDLDAFLGKDRVSFIVKELQQISRTEASSPRPMILLAYIAYGSGQESAAADYLKQATERAGNRPDPLIEAMRKTWTLPGDAKPAPAPSKSAPAPEQPTTTEQPAPAPQPKSEPPADDLNK
jgi:hypothetical protein